MTGLIPQPFIDDLLQSTDIVELIDGYIPLKKRGLSYLACCPFHHEKSPSFNVVAKKQFYHCFGCGSSGNAISFVMNYLNQSFPEAVETLATRLGKIVPREGTREKNKPRHDLYQLLGEVNTFYQYQLKNEGKQAINYLRSRGVDGAVAKRYQLGFAPDGWHVLENKFPGRQDDLLAAGMLIKNDAGKVYDRYRNRITFPIHDRQGRIIGFGGRVLDAQQKPKYLNSPETTIFQKSKELYGLHQILSHQKNSETIIVVEGYLDVIALAQYGITNAVATLGTATSTYHIQLLAKHAKQLIFCFDGDSAGKQAAWRALENSLALVHSGLEAHFMFLAEEDDPDSLVRSKGKEYFLQCLKQATPLHRFFFDNLTQGLNLATPAGKTQLINKAKPLLHKMDESSYKQLLMEDLSRITHIETHRLEALINPQNEIKAPGQEAVITRSPLRLAVALLLQNPDIYPQIKNFIDIGLLNSEDQSILLKLLLHLEKHPNAHTASLVEIWRNSDYFEGMSKLAAWNHQVPDAELIKEFIDILLFLQKKNRELLICQFIDKSRQEGLTNDEKLNLQEMLKTRHQSVD